MSTKQNGLIIRVQPNEVPPDDYMKFAFDTFKGAWGAAFVKEGALWIAKKAEAMTPKMWDDLRTHTLDIPMTLYLSQSPRELQPFSVVTRPKDDSEIIEVCCILDGEFKRPSWEDDTTPTSEVLVQKYLAPKLMQLFKYNDGDVAATLEALRNDETAEEDILSKITGRGTILLIDSEGQVTTYAKDEKSILSQPWGIATHHLGWKPPALAAPEPEPEPAKEEGILSAFSSGAAKVVKKVKNAVSGAAVASVPPAGERPKLTTVDGLKKDEQPVQDAGTKYCKWKPNDGMSRSAAKDKYKTLLGYLPNDWKDFPEVDVPVEVWEKYAKIGGTFRTFAEAGTALEVQRKPSGGEAVKKSTTRETFVPQKVAAAAGVHPDVKGPAVSGEILPIMAPEGIKALKNGELLKTLGTNSDAVKSVEELKEMIRQFPGLFEQLKLPAHLQSNWDFEDFQRLGSMEPKGLAILCYNIELERRLLATRLGEKVGAGTAPAKKVKNAA